MDSRVSSVLYLSYKISTLSSCIMYFIHFLIHRQGTCNIFPTMFGKFRIYSFFKKNVCAFCIITLLKQSCTSERSQSNGKESEKKKAESNHFMLSFLCFARQKDYFCSEIVHCFSDCYEDAQIPIEYSRMYVDWGWSYLL